MISHEKTMCLINEAQCLTNESHKNYVYKNWAKNPIFLIFVYVFFDAIRLTTELSCYQHKYFAYRPNI